MPCRCIKKTITRSTIRATFLCPSFPLLSMQPFSRLGHSHLRIPTWPDYWVIAHFLMSNYQPCCFKEHRVSALWLVRPEMDVIGRCKQIGVLYADWLPLRIVDRPMRPARCSSEKLKTTSSKQTLLDSRRIFIFHTIYSSIGNEFLFLFRFVLGTNFPDPLFVRLGWKNVPDDEMFNQVQSIDRG